MFKIINAATAAVSRSLHAALTGLLLIAGAAIATADVSTPASSSSSLSAPGSAAAMTCRPGDRRHLGKHIPGNPTVIVQNVPSRIAAANHVFSTVAKDGTVTSLLQRGILLAKLLYPSSVRFDIEKFNWLGSLNSETAVTLAWHTAPDKVANDLFDKELIVGGITGVDPETTPRLYNSLIGTKFKVVTGYNSTAQIALAIERGEVQGIADWSWSSLQAVRPQWLGDKQITLLMQGALKNDPELKACRPRSTSSRTPPTAKSWNFTSPKRPPRAR